MKSIYGIMFAIVFICSGAATANDTVKIQDLTLIGENGTTKSVTSDLDRRHRRHHHHHHHHHR